jgi:hypothetical protein
MAESDSKDLTAALASRGQAPVLALVLILAAIVGVLNLPPRPGGGPSASDATARSGGMTAVLSGPPLKAGVADALEALEPLQRFLNLNKTPSSLEELAAALTGYRVTTLIATLSDPKDSRLGYDFDMAIEAIQRAIESEDYTLDRFRFPWLDPDLPPTPPAAPPAPSPSPGPGAKVLPAGPASGPPPSGSPAGAWRGRRHERQPGTILFRIDRQAGAPGQPAAPQELLLLLVVGETPTWGIQQEALATSLNIAWSLDVRRNSGDAEREAVIRILGPTFSGSADSLARVLRSWTAESPERRDARFWVCSGAATAIEKKPFESNALPAQVTYASTVIPDKVLLGELYRFLANPTRTADPPAGSLPKGKIALLVESGSGYGSVVGMDYGTVKTAQFKRIVSIPFPSQIAEVRAAASESVNGTDKGRMTIPFDPPSGRQSDRLPALSPKMTIATDNLILSNILATIANEDIRYVAIVATDILDVIYLTQLIRENCPDVQVILVGNDLRYTDPRFTLDFRGSIIVSSYPLDARAQIWSYPFQGASERRLFANEFDVGRYNAGLVLINGVTDPDHDSRLVVDASKAEDFLVYGKPFVATSFDSFNRRPQIWINQVGQFNVWPLRVLPLSRCKRELRDKAEALIPPIVSLNPHADSGRALRFEYDFPLFWKLVFCAATFLALMLVGIILYTNFGRVYHSQSRSSLFGPLLRRFEVTSPDRSRKNLFLIVMLVVALAVPYSFLVAPLDVALPPVVSPDGEQDARLVVGWDVYALAGLGIATLAGLLLPLGLCLRGVFLKDAPDDRAGRQQVDRWLAAESLLYRCLALTAVLAGALCIGARIYRFFLLRPELPNDWLALDRSAHLLGGISPIVPVACLGAAILWWTYLELKRIHSSPLLRREADLISLRGVALPADSPWKRVIPRSNARFRLCVDLLEYPITILLSKNLPLAGLIVSAAVGLVVFVWGVVWPRFIPTPEGLQFDLLIVVALMCYLLLLLYSQVRYIWLWRSLIRLFRQLALLPMAGAFDRIPPRVAAKFGRFLKTSLHEDIDLEIPLQQCRLVLDQDPAPGEARLPDQETLRAVVAGHPPHSDLERFEIVSNACVRPVVERAWPRRSLEAAYGGSIAGDAPKPAAPDQAGDTAGGLDPATARWLTAAEDLLALRIVYLVSQFAGPLRSISAQLIYGPILLLLAVAWYPFHPLKLMTIVIWAFIAAGVAATLMVLVQIERNDFVSKVARTAPNTFKLDQTFISNLLPYAVPAAGFLLTAFPPLGYWLGSLLGPIGRAVK